MKSKESALKRINRVIKFYTERGQNRETVNNVYRKILKQKHELHT